MTDYQKYQLQWMIAHGYSLQDLIAGLTCLQYADPKDSDRISTPVSELFDEWETDSGFNSEIWACEAEWRDCEGSASCDEIVDAEFTSVWDGGFCITTPCKVNLSTREVFDIGVSTGTEDVTNELDEEYVMINGTKYPVVESEYYDSSYESCGYYWYS